jgi:hypothetical protein
MKTAAIAPFRDDSTTAVASRAIMPAPEGYKCDQEEGDHWQNGGDTAVAVGQRSDLGGLTQPICECKCERHCQPIEHFAAS